MQLTFAKVCIYTVSQNYVKEVYKVKTKHFDGFKPGNLYVVKLSLFFV